MPRPLRALSLVVLLASCSTLPFQRAPFSGSDVELSGRDEVGQDRFVGFALERNPEPGRAGWARMYQAYRSACRAEGISLTAALVQMLHETGYLRFGGTVQARQNNFAGLGTVDARTPGLSFPDVETGALAHVQHLKAYANTEPLRTTLVDPRFKYVKRGICPTLRSLTGKWAMDPLYGDKLMKLYRALSG